MTRTIICSHGFAVRLDSLGMFPNIAAAFADDKFKMFDYSKVEPNGDTIFRSLPDQSVILKQQIDLIGEGEIILLCHSLGCVVAALTDLTRIDKIVLLAPPTATFSREKFIRMLNDRKGSIYRSDSISVLPRSDGTTSYLPNEFFDSIDNLDPLPLFKKIADQIPMTIIRALNDEMLGLTKVDGISKSQVIDIESDHNFTGVNRLKLIEVLTEIFS